jgi:Cys-tRNA synthase (O-phospho-L-seryl-tRNA:Cys-tRNA synthase)
VLRGVPEDSKNGYGCAEDEVAWEEEWVDHHYRLAMATVRESFEPRSVEIFDRSVAGATVAELAGAFSMTEEAVRKVRQRIRDRMEELIAEQVREEDELDTAPA